MKVCQQYQGLGKKPQTYLIFAAENQDSNDEAIENSDDNESLLSEEKEEESDIENENDVDKGEDIFNDPDFQHMSDSDLDDKLPLFDKGSILCLKFSLIPLI